MSLIAQLASAGIAMSREDDRTLTPADAAMLVSDLQFSSDFLSALPEIEMQDLDDAQKLESYQLAMESLTSLYTEANHAHKQISAEGMKSTAGVRVGSLRLMEMRERVGFSNVSFSVESHEELVKSSEGFLQSIWDAIVKVAAAIKNFFKRLFGMSVDDDEMYSSDAIDQAAVTNMQSTLSQLNVTKPVTIPKDVFEKAIMPLKDTSDARKLLTGVEELKTNLSWFASRKEQLASLMESAESLTPMDMPSQFTNAVSGLAPSPLTNKKDTHVEDHEVIKDGYLLGFSSGRSMCVYTYRPKNKSNVSFKMHLFDDKPETYSDMSVQATGELVDVLKQYSMLQRDFVEFSKKFGEDIVRRQEKFEKWAEDHAKRNSEDSDKPQMEQLLASIRATQTFTVEIGNGLGLPHRGERL